MRGSWQLVSLFLLGGIAAGLIYRLQTSTAELELPAAEQTTTTAADSLPPGFHIVHPPDVDGDLFVHDDSPCWLELPKATSVIASSSSKKESPGFVGGETCAECHLERYNDFVKTAHHNASSVASAETIEGPFHPGPNRLETNHPDLAFEMVSSDDGSFYQDIHFRSLTKRVRFDIVTGAGNVAQTYLFWNEDELYQMHVSYYRDIGKWGNSPGYHDGTAWYTRPVVPECVECHTTYMEWKPDSLNRYDAASTLLGVSCERCHGPGREHVEYHRQHPRDRQARHITNPSRLSPDQANDVCAQCHSGLTERLADPFMFRPGDRLEDFWEPKQNGEPVADGVHTSNQLTRLKLSPCFTQSEALLCSTCHNPHQLERGNLKLFSDRCLKCHTPNDCGKAQEIGPAIRNNCIDCHMPMGQDSHIAVETPESVRFPAFRDHYIRVLQDSEN